MSKSVKNIICILLTLLTFLSPVGILPSSLTASAATYDDLNSDDVFLKQQTAITCTLASAAMLMRRTAICADFSDWTDITESNIRETAWIDGLGLLWSFTYHNITMGHGYFSGSNNKKEIIKLLEKNPQGFVIYNTGNEDQNHAVLLCDYDEKSDIFYVADPASDAPGGRIPLSESTIVGETQENKLKNISAYWYIVSHEVTVDKDGNYSARELPDIDSDIGNSGQYDPEMDMKAFEESKTSVLAHYVVTDETAGGSALRTYPSGNSSVYERVNKGTIVYIVNSGKNDFGATWYETNTGHYIFSNNLSSFEEYSAEVVKFENTAKAVNATYSVNESDEKRTSLRLEPSEGNNIVAYADNGTKLYITHSGVNSVGAVWLKTEEGYYVKKSQMKFESSSEPSDSMFAGEYSVVTGSYSAEPIEDQSEEKPSESVKYKITASALNVRNSPVDGDVLGILNQDTVVEVTTVLDGWGKISYQENEGWISLEYAEKVADAQSSGKVESIKLSKDVVYPGESVECTVNIADDGDYTYNFSVYNESGKMVYTSLEETEINKFSYSPDKSGVYYFSIDVKSSDGKKLNVYSRNFTVNNKVHINSIKSNVDEYSFTYEEITWTVDADVDSDTAIYKYSLFFDDKLLFKKESVSGSFTYKPVKKGSYVLKVYLEDEFSSSEEIVSDAVLVYDVLKINSIKLSESTVSVGDEVVCTIDSEDGVGRHSYSFSLFKDDKKVENGVYSDSNEKSFEFSESGNYKIFCAVKDSASTIVSSFSAEIVVSDIMPGDVNSDGKITAGDARLVLRHSARVKKLPDSVLPAADVNGDNAVNAADARKVLRCAAKLEKI